MFTSTKEKETPDYGQIYTAYENIQSTLSKGYQSCQNYFGENREKIKQATPTIQKVSLCALALLSLIFWTYPTLFSGVAGFLLSDKVNTAIEKTESILQKAKSTPLGIKHDWSQLDLEEKKFLACMAIVMIAIAAAYLPWSSPSIPIGLYAGSTLRVHAESFFQKG